MEKTYERINWANFPSEETPINETNLNKMDEAIDELDNRVLGLDSAKLDKSTADEKFAEIDIELEELNTAKLDKTTADEMISEMDNKKLDKTTADTMFAESKIKNTAMGDTIHLTDSDKGKVLAFGLYGKALQNKYSGKNKLKYPYFETTKTVNGITFTDLGDGRIKANGTATVRAGFNLHGRTPNEINDFSLPNGNYIFSGCPSGGGTSTYRINFGVTQNGVYKELGSDHGNGITFTANGDDFSEDSVNMGIAIDIMAGQTIDLIFEPMISVEGGEFEPYVGGIPAPSPNYPQEITISKGKYDSVAVTLESGDRTEVSSFALRTDGIAGIPVDSEGNYTDENGQQWICDEIVKYADGTGKRIQRIGRTRIEYLSGDGYATSIQGYNISPANFVEKYGVKYAKNNSVKSNMLSSHFIEYTRSGTNGIDTVENGFEINAQGYLVFKSSDLLNLEDWKSWLLENELIIYFVLEEPIETDLTADELKVYENLQTFYPVTNISNNANCGMSITYVADTKNYIDNKIASLEKALYNNI